MYVPDESVLGNPGIFGFIGDAAKKVGEALGISGVKVTIPSPTVQVVPTTAATRAAATGAVQQFVGGIPGWVMPAAVAGVALLLLMPRRR